VIPWLIFALAVPLVIVVFVAARRRTSAYERPANEDPEARAELEREFAGRS
jgi:hypothetical protein